MKHGISEVYEHNCNKQNKNETPVSTQLKICLWFASFVLNYINSIIIYLWLFQNILQLVFNWACLVFSGRSMSSMLALPWISLRPSLVLTCVSLREYGSSRTASCASRSIPLSCDSPSWGRLLGFTGAVAGKAWENTNKTQTQAPTKSELDAKQRNGFDRAFWFSPGYSNWNYWAYYQDKTKQHLNNT